jgi:hypothetical protein
MKETELLEKDLQDGFLETLQQALKDQKDDVAVALKEHFAGVRKLPVEDLDARMEAMSKAIDELVPLLRCRWKQGELVVSATGSGDSVWTLLVIGSDWFDPSPELGQVVLAALRV